MQYIDDFEDKEDKSVTTWIIFLKDKVSIVCDKESFSKPVHCRVCHKKNLDNYPGVKNTQGFYVFNLSMSFYDVLKIAQNWIISSQDYEKTHPQQKMHKELSADPHWRALECWSL